MKTVNNYLMKRGIEMGNKTSFDGNNSKLVHVNIDSIQNIHSFGVNYIVNFLDRVGFTIIELKSEPNHHYQLLAKINNKSLMIAVRTAYHPDVGTIDSFTIEKMIEESKELNALPHFTSLSVLPMGTSDMEAGGAIDGQEVKVIFNGLSAIKKSDLLAVNG